MYSGKRLSRQVAGLVFCVSLGITVHAQSLSYTTTSTEALESFGRGLEAYDDFDHSKAAELFNEAIQADSGFAMAWYYEALTAPTTAQYLDYLSVAETLSSSASEPERLIIESALAIKDGKAAEAQADLEKLVRLVPDDARVHYMAGNFYFDRGNWVHAEREYRSAIDLDSSFAAAYDRLGYTYAFEQRYEEALTTLREYVALRPDSPKPYNSRGDIYLYMGNSDSSMAAYAHALSLSPNFVLSMVGEGNTLIFTDRFDSARVIFKHILLQARTSADTNMAYSHAAWSYLYEGKPDRAIEALEAQLEYANSTNDIYTMAEVHSELAAIYLERGSYRRAMLHSDQVREFATMPGFDSGPAGRYLRDANFIDAICYVRLDKREQADSSLQAYRTEAENSGSTERLADYHALAGIAAYWNEDYTTSIEELKQANSHDPFSMFYLGLAYQARGEREQARRVFERLANYNRDSRDYALIRSAARGRLER